MLCAKLDSLRLPDSQLEYYPRFLGAQQADQYLNALLDRASWHNNIITIFGKSHPEPRLSAWYGDPDALYSYSGLTLKPQPWLIELRELQARLAERLNLSFNSVLLNYYRNGQDSMGWHSDDEPELGPEPVIASISLGVTRRFRLQHKKTKQSYGLDLEHGSLLLMSGPTQRHWRHQIPKTKTVVGVRLNLTFRQIIGVQTPP